MATEARRLAKLTPPSAFKGEHLGVRYKTPQRFTRTRAQLIRDTLGKQSIPNRKHCLGTNLVKWTYGDILKVGSINVKRYDRLDKEKKLSFT